MKMLTQDVTFEKNTNISKKKKQNVHENVIQKIEHVSLRFVEIKYHPKQNANLSEHLARKL